jgi:uncharacterized protein (TIGR03435 family)
MRARQILIALAMVLVTCALDAEPQVFEAASVKRNTTNGIGSLDLIIVRPGQLFTGYATVRELIRAAYGVEQNQVVEGPAWVDSDHFQVNAAVPTGTTIDGVRLMLQALLAERFGLGVHPEQRELQVFVLETADRPGKQLWKAEPECRPISTPPGLPVPAPPPPAPPATGPVTVLGENRLPSKCPSMFFTGHMSVRNVPIALLAFQLSRQLRRQVMDRTGLTGMYDFDLTYTPEGTAPGLITVAGGISGDGPVAPPASSADAPALATALRDQLGLRLKSARAPIDVIVIDRVNAPTEN